MDDNDKGDLSVEIYEFLDLINFTLSEKFVEKWRYKFSEVFVKHFQFKILSAFQNQKPIKTPVLYKFLTKKCKYSEEQVLNFFDSIDLDLYKPLIYGRLENE